MVDGNLHHEKRALSHYPEASPFGGEVAIVEVDHGQAGTIVA